MKKQIRREAELRLAKMGSTPTLREIYAPKVIFGAIFVLAVIGGLLVGKVSKRPPPEDRPIPHLTCVKSLDVLATALARYKHHVGSFPTTEQGLLALNMDFGTKGWMGPYLVQLNDDPWGRKYVYKAPISNDFPRLFSVGPDGMEGTRDDLYPGEEFFTPNMDWTNSWRAKEARLPRIIGLEDSQ